jgi:SAM-dependent methyltransferase
MRPVMPEGDLGTRTQELPPVFAVNGAFYLLPPSDLRNSKSFYSEDMLPLIMEEPGADVDIDTEFDWKIAELFARQYVPSSASRKDPGMPESNRGALGRSGPDVADAKYRGDFYLEEDRAAEPKEIFKLLASLLGEDPFRRNGALLDVGCATGELLHYLGRRFPDLSLHGIDVNEDFLDRARRLVPNARFTLGALEDVTAVPPSSVDYCIVSGVVGIFDEIEPLLSNILSWLKGGGTTLIVSQFNEDPVDVVMRYRRAEEADTGWEKGWNIFARATVDRYLAADHRVGRWDYVPFRIPFALPRVKDPMRTWTIATDLNRYQLFNGARQMVDLSVLRIVKSSSE